jgi:hypothetical protein
VTLIQIRGREGEERNIVHEHWCAHLPLELGTFSIVLSNQSATGSIGCHVLNLNRTLAGEKMG